MFKKIRPCGRSGSPSTQATRPRPRARFQRRPRYHRARAGRRRARSGRAFRPERRPAECPPRAPPPAAQLTVPSPPATPSAGAPFAALAMTSSRSSSSPGCTMLCLRQQLLQFLRDVAAAGLSGPGVHHDHEAAPLRQGGARSRPAGPAPVPAGRRGQVRVVSAAASDAERDAGEHVAGIVHAHVDPRVRDRGGHQRDPGSDSRRFQRHAGGESGRRSRVSRREGRGTRLAAQLPRQRDAVSAGRARRADNFAGTFATALATPRLSSPRTAARRRGPPLAPRAPAAAHHSSP